MDTRQLQQSMLFRGMTELEITKALQVLEAHEKSFQKGETLLIAGTITERMGLVLEGSVTIESNDAWGNRTIISHVGQGQVFAETYALLENEPMLVDVTASEDCRVFFLRSGRIQSLKNSLEPWALKYITNLLTISMHKNLILSGRSFHTAPKTIRGRVMAYLNSVSLQKHSREFDIPFDRQQLADYLNLERSALSKELGKMQMWRIAMKPGKPVAKGEVRGVPFIGLPGNPVSGFVTFLLFAQPLILKLSGRSQIDVKGYILPLAFDYKCGSRREFIRGRRNGAGELENYRTQNSAVGHAGRPAAELCGGL